MPAGTPLARIDLLQQSAILRRAALTDFICDPDGHSVRWHYERTDRTYAKIVQFVTFQSWSAQDHWIDRRVAYWEAIEKRIRENMADEYLRRRLSDLEKFERRLDLLDRYLEPCLDEKGQLVIDVTTGLPKMPLKLPSMDKFLSAYLNLHERVMLLRGEAINRTEKLNGGAEGDDKPLAPELRERSLLAPKISRQDARIMARAILRQRGAVGAAPPGAVIDASGEEPKDADSNSTGGDSGSRVQTRPAQGSNEGAG